MGRPDDFDELHFRRVLGHFCTGVSLVTGSGEGGPAGLAVGSFMSVSLEPQLVAICPGLGSTSWPAIRETGSFCVNVLGEHQGELARGFAASGGDKFERVGWRSAPSGSPIIDEVVAWIDCEIESEQEAGDHWLVIGRVIALDVENTRDPLLFHRGAFERIERSE